VYVKLICENKKLHRTEENPAKKKQRWVTYITESVDRKKITYKIKITKDVHMAEDKWKCKK
jgi:hypothetical protein